MLKLARHVGESIYIGDDIIITVLRKQGKQTIIGIDAPRDVPVHREEVYSQKAVADAFFETPKLPDH